MNTRDSDTTSYAIDYLDLPGNNLVKALLLRLESAINKVELGYEALELVSEALIESQCLPRSLWRSFNACISNLQAQLLDAADGWSHHHKALRHELEQVSSETARVACATIGNPRFPDPSYQWPLVGLGFPAMKLRFQVEQSWQICARFQNSLRATISEYNLQMDQVDQYVNCDLITKLAVPFDYDEFDFRLESLEPSG
ncbi:hypothetical protein A1Q2_06895 [Trichosporon asahii var. asahii CBS 8904]|uniref:Uncharacterized protein n=1 Tax=Trichosporon asahii var. asahii (strain CBS 8904) TaxID=1220162 RepID=K1VQ18_TRIAC|nr:hypothetical protein A1Q2_06895 [Trichosporon asahii var. asahii CBS 8904]